LVAHLSKVFTKPQISDKNGTSCRICHMSMS
jgi:cytochrome c peroxidase